jgi:hypothetical protein
MSQLITIKSNLSKTGAALLLISLGTACGSSADATSDGGSSTDGMGSKDGRSTGDGWTVADREDMADAGDAGSGGDAGRDGDAASSGDAARDGDAAPGRDAALDGDAAHASDASSTLAVNLGTSGKYVILAQSGISTVPASAVTGDIGVSPIAATAITGFSLILDSTNVFSTSTQVVGHAYAADYALPTPSNLTTAISDMQTAFTDAAGRTPGVTELGAGTIGGMTLTPGVYAWSTALLIPTNVTLMGSATDVWIFQVAQTLTMSSATTVFLTGGAVAKNVFWQVSGLVDLGTTAHLEGIILGQTSIALQTGASINGRLLAQTAVTLDSSAVVEPAL